MSVNPGMGVMIGMLGGNADTIKAVQSSLNKVIDGIELTDAALTIRLSDGSALVVCDSGQSCCETRYMRTDDNVDDYAGATLVGLELADAPSVSEKYGEHEVQFLRVNTDRGTFVVSNHNEHNGYYGGFWITAELKQGPEVE